MISNSFKGAFSSLLLLNAKNLCKKITSLASQRSSCLPQHICIICFLAAFNLIFVSCRDSCRLRWRARFGSSRTVRTPAPCACGWRCTDARTPAPCSPTPRRPETSSPPPCLSRTCWTAARGRSRAAWAYSRTGSPETTSHCTIRTLLQVIHSI